MEECHEIDDAEVAMMGACLPAADFDSLLCPRCSRAAGAAVQCQTLIIAARFTLVQPPLPPSFSPFVPPSNVLADCAVASTVEYTYRI